MSRTIDSIISLVYSKADNSQIDCIVTCSEIPGQHPFTARADDTEEHGRQLFAELTAGKHGPIAPYKSKQE